MKKLIAIILASLMALSLLCGCDAQTVSEIVDQVVSQTSAAQQQEEQGQTTSYTVEKVNGTQLHTEEKEIDITYPRISGWALDEAQNKWNSVFSGLDIKEEAEHDGDPTIDSVSYNTQGYEITEMNDQLLSILFTGGVFYEGAAHPFGYAFAYTIDMETGDEITLSSLSEDELHGIAKAIAEGRFTEIGNINEFTNEEVLSALEPFYVCGEGDTLESSIFDTISDTESTSGHNYFIKDGKTCIILEVQHAAGDFVILQID